MDCWVPFCFGFPVVLLDLLTLALPLTADSTGVSEGCLCTYSDLCTKCMKGGPCNDKGIAWWVAVCRVGLILPFHAFCLFMWKRDPGV